MVRVTDVEDESFNKEHNYNTQLVMPLPEAVIAVPKLGRCKSSYDHVRSNDYGSNNDENLI